MAAESTSRCSWCGEPIERDDGWRVQEVPGARQAAFCRLEHVVPWSIQGAPWEPGEAEEPSWVEASLESCSQCGAALGEVHLAAIRHRGEHRIPDGFCSVEHLTAWARSGGRWGQA